MNCKSTTKTYKRSTKTRTFIDFKDCNDAKLSQRHITQQRDTKGPLRETQLLQRVSKLLQLDMK